jgi:hypothetical protein
MKVYVPQRTPRVRKVAILNLIGSNRVLFGLCKCYYPYVNLPKHFLFVLFTYLGNRESYRNTYRAPFASVQPVIYLKLPTIFHESEVHTSWCHSVPTF